jgi:hypothetical protein
MDYAEASYFDGAHFSHIAAWENHQRRQRIMSQAEKLAKHKLQAERGALTRRISVPDGAEEETEPQRHPEPTKTA